MTEFIDGEQLSKFLARHPTGAPLGTVKGILLDLARAIEEAHERGWQRGEICPSDILIEKTGAARLSPVDFSNIRREQALLAGNFLVDRESLAYMSPERFFGQQRTELTDQYSLGLVATELLGGARLPRVVSPSDLERKRTLFAELESGKGEWARRSPEFAGVVSRMLRVDPEARWPSMSDVRRLPPGDPGPRAAPGDRPEEDEGGLPPAPGGRGRGEREFFRKFYENLFALCPDVEPHFRQVDMARQYQILNRAIHLMVGFRPESGAERDELRQVACGPREVRAHAAALRALSRGLRQDARRAPRRRCRQPRGVAGDGRARPRVHVAVPGRERAGGAPPPSRSRRPAPPGIDAPPPARKVARGRPAARPPAGH